MISSLFFRFRLFSRRLWVRSALISGLALIAAFLAPLGNYIPFGIAAKIDEETLQDLLDVITASMLTVSTFSLSIMVSAHLAADANTTPRAHRMLQQDSRTQTVIATFIGAFVYALAMTVMIDFGVFQTGEFALIYAFTVAVAALIVAALLRWVGHLDGLGSVEATLRRAEARAVESIDVYRRTPFLGGRSPKGDVAGALQELTAERSGFLQNVDTGKLSKDLDHWGGTAYLRHRPGAWLAQGDVLAEIGIDRLDEDRQAKLRAAFTIDDRREPGQDVIQSLIVLAEIGERALSPGINDPRTGLDAISRITRLVLTMPAERELDQPPAPRVFVPALKTEEVLAATLDPLARDGKAFFEVQISIQTAAAQLATHDAAGIREAAVDLSARGLAYAEDGLLLAQDMRKIAARALADGPAATLDADRAASPQGDGPDPMHAERAARDA
ncbi:DUF2254 domain-containing protein [Palleronia abyssalis]|uniref:DUF2254 domain-containing protein n=1 Tax=Palleronia abyssalis TaxID=1501240 RepID=A0A2R8BUT0_9RHOB|nr:DUF2254 family protein [Palleronia abyssalis]SPJ23924.1 hypothetical protein PAA8504_01745 [Palleronia abyssalis]